MKQIHPALCILKIKAKLILHNKDPQQSNTVLMGG